MDANKNELTEIAVVEYPGADPSAASMLAEMAHVGNRLAQQQGRHTARILVSRWIMASDGGGPQRVAGAEMLDATVPAIIALPGQVSQNGQIRDESVLLDWLSAHYDGGSLMAAVNDGIGVLSRAGLLAGRTLSLIHI